MPLAAFEHMADLEAQAPGEITFEGIHCTLSLQRPALGVILAVFKGPDVGEFGEAPFRELARDLEGGLPIEMFVDASQCLGPSIEVSHDWAQWMSKHRAQLHRVNILSGSRFVEMTASFVRRFTDFGERMRIYTDREAFYEALLAATGARK